ncbi:ATP-binding protein, partial [uncultured Roseibium sp.]|uniref:ATP-binding protein n=1 Tax=uncultured Roseibium sp. TaxID=1936171 RepID=UPI00261EA38E
MEDLFEDAPLTYDPRFLDDHAGSIIKDPATALVELVANSWDAYATRVDITWPTSDRAFEIKDNGIGMNEAELNARWRRFNYNRVGELGEFTNPPEELRGYRPRRAFGRNGKGRYAAFCFSTPFEVEIGKEGVKSRFRLARTPQRPLPFQIEKLSDDQSSWRGFRIIGVERRAAGISAADARSILSTRFLTNPEFEVFVNNQKVTFEDIPVEGVETIPVEINATTTVEMVVIDSEKTDRTTKQHGVAWWVNNRLVGECNWKNFEDQTVLDGRREEAKRYTFILKADHLKSDVLADWSGFKVESKDWKETRTSCENAVRSKLLALSAAKRAQTKTEWLKSHPNLHKSLSKRTQERLSETIDNIMEKCPSLGTTQVQQVMDVLANMELAESQYALLEKMQNMKPTDIDSWNDILNRWTTELAKEALDEVEKRLRVLAELSLKTADEDTKEVQELQPLFERSLWIFGPQFESIEFTSNKGITTVIRNLFGGTEKAESIRPDFVILPDSSIGFYSRPYYDNEGDQKGCAVLSIVELKKPGVEIGSSEKEQVWNYIKSLEKRGYISRQRTKPLPADAGRIIDVLLKVLKYDIF